MARITVYRKNCQLRGKELAANTLASFLVAQGLSSLLRLSTNTVMNQSLLLFLNRKRAINYWLNDGRLATRNGGLILTNIGLDEILNREAGEALRDDGKKKAVNVDPERVRIAREFILSGLCENPTALILLEEFEIM